MMWDFGYGMGWAWLFGALLLIGIVVIGVVLIRLVVGTSGRTGGSAATQNSPPTPRQILDERYARGKLTTEEYRERVQVLGSE